MISYFIIIKQVFEMIPALKKQTSTLSYMLPIALLDTEFKIKVPQAPDMHDRMYKEAEKSLSETAASIVRVYQFGSSFSWPKLIVSSSNAA